MRTHSCVCVLVCSHFVYASELLCVCLCVLLCVPACDLDDVCKLLACIIVDEMSTSGRVAKSVGDINRLFTGL